MQRDGRSYDRHLLKRTRADVTSFSRREFPYCCNKIIGDVTDFELLDEVIGNGEYDAVINAIGILKSGRRRKKSLAVL